MISKIVETDALLVFSIEFSTLFYLIFVSSDNLVFSFIVKKLYDVLMEMIFCFISLFLFFQELSRVLGYKEQIGTFLGMD